MFGIVNSCDHIKLFIFYQFRWLSFWGQPVSQLTFDVYCVSITASLTMKEGYSRLDEASEKCCCSVTCTAARASLVTTIEKKMRERDLQAESISLSHSSLSYRVLQYSAGVLHQQDSQSL